MRKRHPQLPKLDVVMIGWQDLARSCAEFGSPHKHEERLVADILSGLELCGYFHKVMPRQLEKLATRRLSAETLRGLVEQCAVAHQRTQG